MPVASYPRILMVTILVTWFLFFTSAYISLRLGALPWPIIFSIVVSAGLLRLTGRGVNRHDVNMAQAGGSVGGLTAAAVAFVLPGLYLAVPAESLPSPWHLAILATAGGLLGVLLSDRIRPLYIDSGNLPYPAGKAGGELIREGFDQSRLFGLVLMAGLVTGAFVLLRDAFDLYVIPLAIGATVLPFLIAPMGVAAGYLLGPATGANWLAGAILGIFVLTPLAEAVPALRAPGSLVPTALWVQNIGMGLVLGSGLAYLFIYGRLQGLKILLRSRTSPAWPLAVSTVGVVVLAGWFGLSWWAALLVVAAVWVLVPVAAQLTGSTNLDPLEQFGLLATFLVLGLYALFNLPLSMASRYGIAFFAAVATAVAGDIGHDFKSAQVVGTNPRHIVNVDLVAVLALLPAIPVMLWLLQGTFARDLFSATLPAPQAKMVYNTLSGLIDYRAFFVAMGAALVVDGLQHRRIRRSGRQPVILLIPLGIGIFLGWALSFTIALGGLIYVWVRRSRPDRLHAGIVVAAGIMGGEGIVGFFGALAASAEAGNLVLPRLVAAGLLLVITLVILLTRRRPSVASG